MYEEAAANIIIKNERLSVEIANPGTIYKGTRFDWNGFITQVTLDGRHTFCTKESLIDGEGTGGAGLCGEFGIDEALGYAETAVDEYFHKIGVGLLKKIDNKPYEFFEIYSCISQNSSVAEGKDSVSFTTTVPLYGGYAYEYKKTVSLTDNKLKIKYNLLNNGTKKISTTEYCHNFIGIDNENVDSSYCLKLPCNITMESVVGELNADNNLISWPDKNMESVFYCIIPGYNKNNDCSWDIYNSRAGTGVRETDNFQVGRFALWGYKHVISPETFIYIELEPGQSRTWTREYEFYY